MSFLLVNQQCQSTEGNSKHWIQPTASTRRGVGPLTPALGWHFPQKKLKNSQVTNVEKMRTARVNGSDRRRPLLQRISQAASVPRCPTDTARNLHSLHAHTQPSANYKFSFFSNRPSALDSLPAGSDLPTEKLSDFYSTFLEAGCPACHLINSRKKEAEEVKEDSQGQRCPLSTTHHHRFTALFLGPPGWAGAKRELLDFMVQGKINRGRHTDHLAGRHSIRTNQCPPPSSHSIMKLISMWHLTYLPKDNNKIHVCNTFKPLLSGKACIFGSKLIDFCSFQLDRHIVVKDHTQTLCAWPTFSITDNMFGALNI